jgi:ribulose-5-phosphate 4-epimerase/fuculose-1-phosphate aldolase
MNKQSSINIDEDALRVDLAAAFRLAVHFGWNESVGNHFSAAVSGDGTKFLMNPTWRHFATVRASELLLLDTKDTDVMQRPDAPDETAWCIHGAIHATSPNTRVLLHCHPRYSTALATLKDPTMLPIDQNTARFFGKVGIDLNFGGLANNDEEGARIARALGNHSTLMMGNHGITISGQTIAQAFEDLYFFERAAETLMLAYASGQPLSVMSDEIAEATAQEWTQYSASGDAHFDQLKEMLDRTDPSYRD